MAERYSGSSPRRRSNRDGFGERDAKPKGDGGLFGWTIFILLLIGLVALCWMGTLYIFGHPEEPLGYSVLHKFKKLEAPKRFSELAAPKGEFLTAKKLLERYGQMTPRQLEKESHKLLRDYIRNYDNVDSLVPYIVGRFNILDSYQLTDSDFFQSGVVAVAQDSQLPQVIIEDIFTTDANMVPPLHRSLLTGVEIPILRLGNTNSLSPIIHIEKLADGRLKFTTIPIQYPDYTATQGPGGFSLLPPPTLNVEAGLPVVPPAKVTEADQRYASYRRKLANPGAANAPAPTPANALMPVRPATNMAGETPAPAVAVAQPASSPASTPPTAAIPAPTEPPVARAIPVNGTTPPPAAVANAQTVGTDVPLKPFNGSGATAVASTTSGKWQTFKPGAMPRGRLLGMKAARNLGTADLASERLYLRGDFTVTASVGNSAVLRSDSSDPDAAPNTRVVVQFPTNARPPEQGSTVRRGSDRPFQVTNVKQTSDGQVNIYVREVITE
jgi:hypothetical protein